MAIQHDLNGNPLKDGEGNHKVYKTDAQIAAKQHWDESKGKKRRQERAIARQEERSMRSTQEQLILIKERQGQSLREFNRLISIKD